MRPNPLVVLVLAATLACDGPAPAPEAGAGPVIVATLHPLASVVRAVAGPDARVRTLLPPGAHPDSYQATPRDAQALAAARLVVRAGGAADAWIDPPAGVPVVVFAEGVELLDGGGHGDGHEGTGNPHVWLDPVLVRDVLLPRLTDALAELAPDSADAVRRRAAAYADSLTALDDWIRRRLEGAPERRFVAAHPAWPYFAARYGLEPAGVLHASPGREPGVRELAGLVELARERGVRAIIAEPQLGQAGVQALADELDGRIEVADPVGGPGAEGRTDYLSLMRFNARAFARALGGSGDGGGG